jgi:hypothetical protein
VGFKISTTTSAPSIGKKERNLIIHGELRVNMIGYLMWNLGSNLKTLRTTTKV